MHKKSAIVWYIVVLCFTPIYADDDGEIGEETGVLELTEDQFYDLTNDKIDSLQVAKLEEHQYSSLKSSPDTNTPPLPVDCWKLSNRYMSANLAIFQAWANKYCRLYRSCWCCPNGGLCVAFFVNPTCLSSTITDQTYAPKIAVFEA
jgi:hypothetical protein